MFSIHIIHKNLSVGQSEKFDSIEYKNQRSAIVLSDMLSDSIEYKDL